MRHGAKGMAALLVAALWGIPVSTAFAAESPPPEGAVTWSVRPATSAGIDGRKWVERAMDPGGSATEYLAVTNYSDRDITFALTAADGYFTDDGHFTMRTTDAPSVDAGTWVGVQDSVAVAAGATSVVPFTITVPANATPGDHAAGIAAGISTAANGGGSSVGVTSRMGFRVMLTISGELKPQISLSDVSADYQMSWNPFAAGSVKVNAKVKNTGNVLVASTTDVTAQGRSVLGAQQGARELMPGDSTDVAGVVTQVWPLGFVTVDLKATGVAGENKTQVAATASVVALALPLPQFLTLIGLALLIFAVWWERSKARRRWTETVREQLAADAEREKNS